MLTGPYANCVGQRPDGIGNMNSDRPMLGVFLMIGFTLTAPGMDALAKLAGDRIPVGQILAYRFCIQAALLLPLAAVLGHLRLPRLAEACWHVVRAALILSATGFFFTALKFMAIADAIAIFFVEPFMVTLLGAVFLGERIGWRRILACAAGFLGALLVIRPSFAAFGPVALFPLATAICFSLYMILTRHTARSLHPVTLQAWTALAASALILLVLAAFRGSGVEPFDPAMPEGRYWAYLAGVGVVSTISHMMVSGALRFAPTATVAPLQYLEIIAATILGFLIFSDIPDAQTVIGVAVIISSGLFVIWRERHHGRNRS